ncbi:MAG: Hsp20/alpha crystallin family protein [Acidobacteria bacterium]|nr:Hsp20/alpha crystallin family protein [Acidobacteriota bacterium]
MLTRWNPFEELTSLHREMDRLFSRAWDTQGAANPSAAFAPAIEVASEKDGWNVRLALPGVDPKDVHIEVAGNTLTVRGERRREDHKNEPYMSEITYGRFERTLTLPESIDGEKVTAAYRNGLLELTLPLRESVKPRKIEIAA